MMHPSPKVEAGHRREAIGGWIRSVLLLLLVAFVGCSGDDGGGGSAPTIQHPEDFFPSQIGGMAAEGSPTTATTPSELRDLIDGGYEIYTNHTFQEFAEQNYEGTTGDQSATLTAWIFELATVGDAEYLFEDEQVQTGACSDWTGLGDQAQLCLTFDSQTIQFQRDRYWVQMNINRTSPDAEDVLVLLGGHIDQEITQ